ncbi:MAG: DUF2723 domain-containing protein, partial [Armatimonadetes bacterium]|nr:DUF2723 domain-containing protein [Armatimonadota bacterium]
AGAAAGAVSVLYLLGRALLYSRWAAAVVAALLGGCYTFWSQSVRVEVYSLHVLLLLTALLGAVRYRSSGATRDLLVAALGGSLGLAHHLSVALLAPSVLLLIGRRWWESPARGRQLAGVLGVVAIGPLSYGLLVLWEQAKPLQCWGAPASLSLLLVHASAKIYSAQLLKVPDLPRILVWLREGSSFFLDNFPLVLGLAPVLGITALWKRDRLALAAVLLGAVASALYNLCYQLLDPAPYYLGIWALGFLLAGAGLEKAAALLPRTREHRLAPVLLVCCVLAPVARNWTDCDLSRAVWVREFACQKLESAAPNGVVITQGDDDTHSMWYVHDLLRVRPDVVHLDRNMLRGTWLLSHLEVSQWYIQRLRRQGVAAPEEPQADAARRRYLGHDGYLIELLEGPLAGRPIHLTFLSTPVGDEIPLLNWSRSRFAPIPVGLLVRLYPHERSVDLREVVRESSGLWSRFTLPELAETRTDQEMSPRYTQEHYTSMLLNLGGLYERLPDPEAAAALYQRVLEWRPDAAEVKRALDAVRGARRTMRSPEARRGAAS